MSDQRNREKLQQAFAEHLDNVRARQNGTVPDRRTRVTILSGPSGIGKTACVDEFAADIEYQIIHLNCSFEPANFLVFRINNAINDMKNGKIKGCIILIDYIDDADDEWCDYLEQFCSNQLSCEIEMQSESGKFKKTFAFDKIPEQIFIVGESHADD